MPSASDAIDARLGFAYALAALAGAVDAIAVLSLGDVFVSFMSGNTTLLGNAVTHLHGRVALQIALVLLCFLAGVIVGEAMAVCISPRLRPTAVLAAVSLGLTIAALSVWRGADHTAIALCLATTMGVQNAALRRAGGMDVALTYVTGTLVRLGRAIAAAIIRRGSWQAVVSMAWLWASFALGASLGGVIATSSPTVAIAVAAACAGMMSMCSAVSPRRAQRLSRSTRA